MDNNKNINLGDMSPKTLNLFLNRKPLREKKCFVFLYWEQKSSNIYIFQIFARSANNKKTLMMTSTISSPWPRDTRRCCCCWWWWWWGWRGTGGWSSPPPGPPCGATGSTPRPTTTITSCTVEVKGNNEHIVHLQLVSWKRFLQCPHFQPTLSIYPKVQM